jgi:uncharacterized membrane protein YkvA (DUF1232 family)
MAEQPVGRGRLALAWLGIAASSLYLVNPGAGVFELLPDNLPGIGNLDEASATLLLVACARLVLRARKARLAAASGERIQPSASDPAVGRAEPPQRS